MWWSVAGVLGALGVLLGAFGAHGLEALELDPRALEWWDTANRFHLVHALAIIGVAAHPRKPRWVGALFVLGIVLFSGSLYTMALTGLRPMGGIVPLGGLSWVAAWIALAAWPRDVAKGESEA